MRLDTTSPMTRFRLTVTSSTTYERITASEGNLQDQLQDLDGSSWSDDPDPSYRLQSTSRGYWSTLSADEVLKLQKNALLTGPEARQLLSFIVQG